MNDDSARSIFKSSLYAALLAAAAVYLVAAGMHDVMTSLGRSRPSPSPAASADSIRDVYERLERFASSPPSVQPVAKAKTETTLPDVDTMIQRLSARLDQSPDDVDGWKMLGWSYSQMARYEEAAAAYEKAMKIEPGSTELQRRLDEAKANAAGKGTAADPPNSSRANETQQTRERTAAGEQAHGYGAEIHAMVDRLSDRLRKSPHDVEGWIQLIRSRVVLGDAQAAARAIRDAIDAFQADAPARTRISAVAVELGLSAE